MNMPVEDAAFTRGIRRLTVAIWALVIALIGNAAILFLSSFLPMMIFANHGGESFSMGSSSIDIKDEFQGFHDWPLEKQLASASAVAITVHKNEDGRVKSIIDSIPKGANAGFNYKVGEEYAPASHYPRNNTSYGDGEVIFFTGSPPMMRLSYTYSDGRIAGLGDLPLQKFAELAKAAK